MIHFDGQNARMWENATDFDLARATSPRRIMMHPLVIVAALVLATVLWCLA